MAVLLEYVWENLMPKRHSNLALLCAVSALVCRLASPALALGGEAESRGPRRSVELRQAVKPHTAGAERVQASPHDEPLWVCQQPLLTEKAIYRAARMEKQGQHAVELELVDSGLAGKLIERAGPAPGQRAVLLEEGQPVAVVTPLTKVGEGHVRLGVRSKPQAIRVVSCLLRAAGWGNLGGELWGHLVSYSEDRRYYGRRVGFSLDLYNAGPRALSVPGEYQRRDPQPSLRSGIELLLAGPDGKLQAPLNRSRFHSSEVSRSLPPRSHVRWFGVDLSDWYALEKPGLYEFRVRFSRELCELTKGESNPVTFELVGDSGGSAGGIKVQIEAMGKYQLGGPMRVRYRMENRTTKHLRSVESLLPNSDLAAEVELHRVGADPLVRVPRWQGGRLGCSTFLDFLPGEILFGTLDLADLYCIRQSGTYRVRLVFAQSSGAVMDVRVCGPPVAPVGTDLRGTVYGPEGKPLAGAEVKLSEHRRPYQGGGHETPVRLLGTRKCDAEGRYEFRYLRGDSPRYYFEFTHLRFAGTKKEIEAQPGRAEHVVDARLERGFALHGIVLDGKGQPVEGAKVTDHGSQKWALTDAEGCFRIEGLAHRDVDYHCFREDYGSVNSQFTIQGEKSCLIVLELQPRYMAEGTLSSISGRPFGKLRLELYLKDGRGESVSAYCHRVDHTGRFSLRLPGPGPYSGLVTASTEVYSSDGPPFIAALEGARSGDRDLELRFDDSGGLRVRVSAPGNLPDYAKISVSGWRRYDSLKERRRGLLCFARVELPPSGGIAHLRASPGPVQVRIEIARLESWKCVKELEIESGKQRVVGITVPTFSLGTVRGQVRFPEAGPPRPTHVWFSHSLGSIFTRIEPDGRFTSPPIPAGKVTVRVGRKTTQATVDPDAEADIGEIALEAYGTIVGSVRYPDGTPALGVTVGQGSGEMVGRQGQFRCTCPPGKASLMAYVRDLPSSEAWTIRDVVVPSGGTVQADLVVPKGTGPLLDVRIESRAPIR